MLRQRSGPRWLKLRLRTARCPTTLPQPSPQLTGRAWPWPPKLLLPEPLHKAVIQPVTQALMVAGCSRNTQWKQVGAG